MKVLSFVSFKNWLAVLALMGTVFAWQADAAPRARTLGAFLLGADVVPGPGDGNAYGSATLTINSTAGEIRYNFAVEGLGVGLSAGIYAGAAGSNGTLLFSLNPPAGGISSGTVTGVDRTTLRNLVRQSANYYVEIKTGDFPNGAVRGQLGR